MVSLTPSMDDLVTKHNVIVEHLPRSKNRVERIRFVDERNEADSHFLEGDIEVDIKGRTSERLNVVRPLTGSS